MKGLKLLVAFALLFAVNAHAQFNLGDNNGNGDHIGWNGDGGNNGGGHHGGNDGMYLVERQILCESQNQNAAACATGLERTQRIYLARQISKSACIEGSTYNFYGDRINVTGGCRAYFVARGLTRYPQASDNIIGGGNNGGGGHDGGGGWNGDSGHNGNQGQGSLRASSLYPIGQNLFSTTISWTSFVNGGTSVVTVSVPTSQNPSERYEKLMACQTQGQAQANWIRAQDTYVFKLYVGARCPNPNYSMSSQLGNAADRIVVRLNR